MTRGMFQSHEGKKEVIAKKNIENFILILNEFVSTLHWFELHSQFIIELGNKSNAC